MNLPATDDLRIRAITTLHTPGQVMHAQPASERALRTVRESREHVHNILEGRDDRLIVVIGPCSIHDTRAAM